jgi:hypothetical protein
MKLGMYIMAPQLSSSHRMNLVTIIVFQFERNLWDENTKILYSGNFETTCFMNKLRNGHAVNFQGFRMELLRDNILSRFYGVTTDEVSIGN